MSIAERPALYREPTSRASTHEEIDRALADLVKGKARFQGSSLSDKIALVEACIEGTYSAAQDWVKSACQAKGILQDSSTSGEEVAAGPLATLRYLRLVLQALRSIQATGKPTLPGKVFAGPEGKLRVQVIPSRGLFDSVLFQGFRSYVGLKPGVTEAQMRERMAGYYSQPNKPAAISLVLGAGNVSSIAPTDAFTKLFHEGKVVLLKMNPVNEYLGPIFAKAFAPLIDAGYLRIIYGGVEAGSYAMQHELVDEVHITGSVYSHETIVWGPPGPDRERRKRENDPVLKKEITSELGNVTPWIIVPGPYTERQLRFQAENVAASITNNASFNCIATKMIVTSSRWPDRKRFLDMVEQVLAQVPRRKAYYPGAAERYEKFAGQGSEGGDPLMLPWKIVRDVQVDRDTKYFEEESFVCVSAETALDAASPAEFMERATDFANERLWGTLGAAVMIHPETREESGMEQRFQTMLDKLRYGTIGINHWPALSYAMFTPPWGGYPIGTIQDPQSGIGWVHNTYMLEDIEKTVLEGPLVVSPKPFWFPTHQGAATLGWKVVGLYHRPSVWKLPGLLVSALKG